MFEKYLNSPTDIRDFIVAYSTDQVDEELLLEYLSNCKGILKKISPYAIKFGKQNYHVRDKRKELQYIKLPSRTIPPLIVEKGIVVDGNHRLRIARRLKLKEIYIYDIIPDYYETA